MRHFLIILLGLSLVSVSEARRKRVADDSTTSEDAEEIDPEKGPFHIAHEAIEMNDTGKAILAFISVSENKDYKTHQADALFQLGSLLEEKQLPYSALLAYKGAFDKIQKGNTNTTTIDQTLPKIIGLSRIVGDSSIRTETLNAIKDKELSEEEKSHKHYLMARNAARSGKYGDALKHLKHVGDKSSDFIEARNMESVIFAQQDKPQSALVPLQIALAQLEGRGEDAKVIDVLQLNLARSYYAAGNYPQAAEHYAKVERRSPFWVDAQFERAWAHFRMTDINGALGYLQTHSSPFFDDAHYPEGELLRIYGFFLLCKFQDADREIDIFSEKYAKHSEKLMEMVASSPERLFEDLVDGKLPNLIARHYNDEDRFIENRTSVKQMDAERAKLQGLNVVIGDHDSYFETRKQALATEDGNRIKAKVEAMSTEIKSMLNQLKITKLDIGELQATMLEQAAVTGKMEKARRIAKRRARKLRKYNIWPFEGEYWADELGYFKINAKSECPMSMRPDQNLENNPSN